jgi:diacylglycerol O-acyltransferase
VNGHPQRVLLISATIGEGHNATARAVEEAVHERWPGCQTRWLDALQVMGRWVPRAFNWIYVTNVESTPWLYDFFYAALWRYRWFANASRNFTGAWCGQRLKRVLAEYRPDLIISTYPLGTAGLNWLRRHDLLDVPTAAVVSDFAPHPFWVYPEIDLHYVASQESLRAMERAEPHAVGEVCVPPVVSAFQPQDRALARKRHGLADGFTALLACGSYGFGAVDRALDGCLREDRVRQVVVVCGRNRALHQRLSQHPDPRVVPLGWVEDMPGLLAAADVVVTNAGGATALEALACGRAVVMFEPIAGHGKANARLMARAGLAALCWNEQELTETLRHWLSDPQQLADQEKRALEHASSGNFADQVEALQHLPQHHGNRPLRSSDAFFVHAATPNVPQQTGVLLRFPDLGRPAEEWAEHLRGKLAERVGDLPMLTRRLVLRPGRRPRWRQDSSSPEEHLHWRQLSTSEETGAAVTEFFRRPVRTDRAPWELQLLHDPSGHCNLLVKMHHALGDGLAVTSTLVRLLTDHPDPVRRGASIGLPRRSKNVLPVLRGIAELAAAGFAPRSPVTGMSSSRREIAWAELPAPELRQLARRHRVSTTGVVLALIAEAVHRATPRSGAQQLRVMIPQTTRIRHDGPGADAPGNHTSTLAVDLPVGPMPFTSRLAAVDDQLDSEKRYRQAEAASAVLTAFGWLPAPLHRWIARRVYHRAFFNAIVSVLPGRRRVPRIGGSPVEAAVPVLSLAEGVGLAVGALNWGEAIFSGITTDPEIAPRAGAVAQHMKSAFDLLQHTSGT